MKIIILVQLSLLSWLTFTNKLIKWCLCVCVSMLTRVAEITAVAHRNFNQSINQSMILMVLQLTCWI